MEYAWRSLKSLKRYVENGRNLTLFLDFDGTLSPFAKTPNQAFLPPETKRQIRILKRNKKIAVAIVSGRAMQDVKRKVGIEDILYSGSHGLEYEVNGKYTQAQIPPKSLMALREIKGKLLDESKKYEGAFLEDKDFTLALHYRNVPPKKKFALKERLKRVFEPYLKQNILFLIPSKETFDLRTTKEWTKGHACLLILNMLTANTGYPQNSIYIGDDTSDEDAFFHLRDSVTIRVGKNSKSVAKYYLKDTQDVLKFLIWLNRTLR